MKDIQVKKDVLIEKLKENRAKHRAIFEEAVTGYREQAITLLDQQLDRAKSGKKFNMFFTLIEPVDQTKDYDRAIGMLELSLDGTVSLSESDFRCFVLDEWGWKHQFLHSNSSYSAMAAAAMATEESQE